MTANSHTVKEKHRLDVQATLDAEKTRLERNRMGQFATPSPLAFEVLSYAKRLMPSHKKIHFIDPALGTGSFYSALLRTFPASSIAAAVGYEIDPHYGTPAHEIWSESGLHVELSDFTKATPPETKFNLLICNPPYVRHHHIVNGNKARIQAASSNACGIQFGGLAGLYCHFLGLSHAWMSDGGLAGWLIPSEFMDVNYGDAVKRYLLEKVTLLHIHRFDPHDVQFNDALVSSAIVWFRNEAPPENHAVEFSFGGSLAAPKVSRIIPVDVLRTEAKWTRFPMTDSRPAERGSTLKDFFTIRRGLATGDNDFFILSADEVEAHKLPLKFFKPILPSPRYLPITEIKADKSGIPLIETPLFLLDCRLPETEVENHYPSLWRYLQDGIARGVADRYLCKHRTPWYSQENRPAAPFVCTYLGRGNTKSGRPFRFILNNSQATITNVYLALYPKDALAQAITKNPSLARQVWTVLNEICPESMMAEGRVYGGGLHKLEPKELANVPADALAALLTEQTAEQESTILKKRA
jgi:adenine-specific DNA-methyltransferase